MKGKRCNCGNAYFTGEECCPSCDAARQSIRDKPKEKAMTIEDARNLIGECEDKIEQAIAYLYDETGIAPKGVSVNVENGHVTKFDGVTTRRVSIVTVKIIGMEL